MSRELLSERMDLLFKSVLKALDYAVEARDYANANELATLGINLSITAFINSGNRSHEEKSFPPDFGVDDDDEEYEDEESPLSPFG